ncbi:MAG: ABC transporter permease [Propionibacteriales bacterium]|nr:ABC transporter permease [Propionibacteriales bacterium]
MSRLNLSAEESVGHPGIGHLVRSEVLKIRSTRLWWALLLGAILLVMVQAGFTAAFEGQDQGFGETSVLPSGDSPELVRTVYTQGFFAGYIFALILGITGLTGEYRYQTITPTFLVAPKRYPIVVAKIVAHLFFGVLYGVACTAAAIVAGGIVLVAKGFDFGLTAEGVPRALATSVLAMALWTIFGIGVGTLIKNQIAAILVGVAVAYIVEPLLGLVLSVLEIEAVGKYLPTAASTGLFESFSYGQSLLAWWQGGLVLIAYACLFALLGVLLSVRRDIT